MEIAGPARNFERNASAEECASVSGGDEKQGAWDAPRSKWPIPMQGGSRQIHISYTNSVSPSWCLLPKLLIPFSVSVM